jgi:hypothetical protein
MSWTGDLTDANAEGDYDSDDIDHNDAGRVELKGDGSKEIALFLVFALLKDKSVVEAEWVLYDDLECTITSQVGSKRFTRYVSLLLYAPDVI